MKKSHKLWGGRFDQSVHQHVLQLSKSVHFDHRLYDQDIRCSLAHAEMLYEQGILNQKEWREIQKGLKEIRAEIKAGKFVWSEELEDVHMNIESELTRRYPAGAKLHSGRSRNDQVATDLRLWVKERIDVDIENVQRLQKALVKVAQKHSRVMIAGYTHLQRAQPVYLAHHFLAYVEMFERDVDRLWDCRRRVDQCPLGSGAIAGSTLPLDRESVAKKLGFASLTQNSMDAVSDRDFAVEYAFVASMIALHLSRLGEDLVNWSTAEFGFIRLSDAFTTGSSLMPQKKNPDVAELVRGKSGRVIGNLTSLLVLLKSLPLSYNRDLQEDKERIFDTADTLQDCLVVMAQMLPEMKVNEKRCEEAATDPLLLATDAADVLVKKGVPFREAHEIIGKAVGLCEKLNRKIDQLMLKEWKQIDARVDESIVEAFHPRKALERRRMVGAPSQAQMAQQLIRWNKKLEHIKD